MITQGGIDLDFLETMNSVDNIINDSTEVEEIFGFKKLTNYTNKEKDYEKNRF